MTQESDDDTTIPNIEKGKSNGIKEITRREFLIDLKMTDIIGEIEH